MDPNLGPLDMAGAPGGHSGNHPEVPSNNFGWSVDGKAADQHHHPNEGGSDASVAPKFQRYPSLGSPNIATAPFYFNIG